MYWAFVLYATLEYLVIPYTAKHDYPAKTKHFYSICTMLDQRRRRWADVVQILYKCFVFTWYSRFIPFY